MLAPILALPDEAAGDVGRATLSSIKVRSVIRRSNSMGSTYHLMVGCVVTFRSLSRDGLAPALGAEPLGLYRWMLRLKIDFEPHPDFDSVGSSPPQIQDELLPRNIVGARGGVEDATARGRMGYVRQLFGDPS